MSVGLYKIGSNLARPYFWIVCCARAAVCRRRENLRLRKTSTSYYHQTHFNINSNEHEQENQQHH